MRPAGSAAAWLALAVWIMPLSPAWAHPHVWVDAGATLQFEGGRIIAIGVHWTFDPMFSAVLMDQFDPDHHGSFDADAQAAMARNVFTNLQGSEYYTHLNVAGEAVPLDRYADFLAGIEGDRVVYRFRLPIEPAPDPRLARVSVELYDPEYFVELSFDERSIALVGSGSEACRIRIVDDDDNPIYFGQVVPRKIDLVCTTA